MRDRPTKTHTQSHDKEKKKRQHTQNSKICTAVKVAQGDYRTSHCRNCEKINLLNRLFEPAQ